MPSVNRVLRLLDEEDAVQNINYPYSDSTAILNKEASIKQYVAYMLDRTNTMFEWSNLPPTIPAYMLELYLQIFGYAAFVEVKSTNSIQFPAISPTPPGVYIFFGGIGGERDIYYRPKLFTVANPRVKNSIQAEILYPGDEVKSTNQCVVMPCDRNYMGLVPLFSRYASQLTENDISIRSAQINFRAFLGISASTDRDKEAARKFLDAIEAGKLALIGENAFLDGMNVANFGVQSSNTIIQLIELQQYLKASWFNELGLNVNFNMKREYMSEEEIAVNTDILLPLVDDMLRCRQEFAELVNQKFGLNISVEKSSAWANKEREETAALAEQESDAGIKSTEVDGGIDNEETVQASVQKGVSEGNENQTGKEDSDGRRGSADGSVDQGNDFAGVEGQSEPDAQNLSGEPAGVTININIDHAEEVNADASSSEPEASKKSEEPDA